MNKFSSHLFNLKTTWEKNKHKLDNFHQVTLKRNLTCKIFFLCIVKQNKALYMTHFYLETTFNMEEVNYIYEGIHSLIEI